MPLRKSFKSLCWFASLMLSLCGFSNDHAQDTAQPGPPNANASISSVKPKGVQSIRAAKGDTLLLIAQRWNSSPDVLVRLNRIASDVELSEGKEIFVPSQPAIRGKKPNPRRSAESPVSAADDSDTPALILTDKNRIEAEEIWQDQNGYWYRKNGVAHFIERSRVKQANIPTMRQETASTAAGAGKSGDQANASEKEPPPAYWIYLVGGAKVEVDSVTQNDLGAWYKRENLSIFIEKSRILKIEKEQPAIVAAAGPGKRWSERGWATGNARLDTLIRQNGSRFGVDPYLIFCVMEQESHFFAKAVSPVGARGLMQLMPGTGARFGVRHPFDPAENIMGGTRYLKTLLESFHGRVDLVLAGYNAGEGAVARYGGKVPPYKETRNYVKRITVQYDRLKPVTAESQHIKQTGMVKPTVK